jgi:hypothetical protein
MHLILFKIVSIIALTLNNKIISKNLKFKLLNISNQIIKIIFKINYKMKKVRVISNNRMQRMKINNKIKII